MLHNFVNLQYCYDYLIGQIPVELLLYSHIPPATAALIFGAYVYLNDRKLPSLTLFIVCLLFAGWCFFGLGSWFAFLGAGEMMFAWSLLDLFAVIFFCFAYYFLFSFITGRDLPVWQKILGVALILPTAVTTFLGLNLSLYDANICEAWEHELITWYPYFVEAFIILSALVLAIRQRAKTKDAKKRREIVLATAGLLLFLGFFFSATLSVALLVNYAIGEYAYNYEIYGLFGMPLLLIYLGYLIVRYRAFDIRILSVQALVVALIALIAAQYAFAQSLATSVLITVTLVLTVFAGLQLIRSVQNEIEQRRRVEKLAQQLDAANKQQVVLLHFITHQLKGFMTKSRNIFSMMREGDYGEIPENLKPLVEEGFRSDTKGVTTIQEILSAANIRSGKVEYRKEPFDLKALIDEIAHDLRMNAEAKGISLFVDTGTAPITYTGDRGQLINALKNMIDNAIKYTPQGEVRVTLAQEGATIRFEVADTGVGITAEDMQNLFTEGGHGANSKKVNVESTGFGLYIVKNIVEAHNGTVRAESEGAGKGSRFVVELPV